MLSTAAAENGSYENTARGDRRDARVAPEWEERKIPATLRT
jgi:hypothetical protein